MPKLPIYHILAAEVGSQSYRDKKAILYYGTYENDPVGTAGEPHNRHPTEIPGDLLFLSVVFPGQSHD